jgi:hypothetical protein
VPQELGTQGTGATTSRYEPVATMARSPILVVDNAIKGRHRVITGRERGTTAVTMAPLVKVRKEIGDAGAA